MFGKILSATATAVSKGAVALQKGAEAVKKAQENAGVISEEFPLSTAGLTVYPNRFNYKNTTEYFSDVIGISLSWNSTTTNGLINNQDATVYIRTKTNSYIVSKSTMYLTPKLVKAYQFVAQNTFEFRLQPYLDKLKNNGCIEINGKHYYKESGFFGKKEKSSNVVVNC